MLGKLDLFYSGNEMASSSLPKIWSELNRYICWYTIVGDREVFHKTHKNDKPNPSKIWGKKKKKKDTEDREVYILMMLINWRYKQHG